MINDSRKTVRKLIAGLLSSALVGTGLPVQACYDYQIGDFGGQSPVVVVSSRGGGYSDLTFQGTNPVFEYNVHVFVLYATEDGTWTESNAEDTLDDIEALIRQVLENNKKPTMGWESITLAGMSQTDSITIGGIEYRTELFVLRVE